MRVSCRNLIVIYPLNMSTPLPDCPDFFSCCIIADGTCMIDPVFTADGHSYERSAIEQWFKNKSTSPKTGLPLDSKALSPNLTLLSQINEWKDDQLKGRADHRSLDTLKANLFGVATSKEGQIVVQKMIQLITSSNFCLLSPDGVERLKLLLKGVKLLDKDLTDLLDFLASQCQSEINTKQERYRELSKKSNGLELAKANVLSKQEKLKNKVTTTQEKAAAAENMVPIAEKQLKEAQDNLDKINQAVVDTKKKNTKAKKKLVKYKTHVHDVSKLCSEYLNERDNIERQLDSVNATENENGDSSSSSSSSSSVPTGSKRGRSSSSSSSSSSSTTRGSKRSKKEKDGGMKMHPGQWLYKEGMAYRHGFDFKKIDKERGISMIEASASSGFPMAVAFCHCCGWNGKKKDEKKAFDMFVKIEKETNGYHWAQYILGKCYEYGHGVDKDEKKGFESYSLSAEQGNNLAMISLGYCYSKAEGTDENKTKGFEWYEKGANLGYCVAMYNVGVCYSDGEGVTEDTNKAREWYTKAAAQGHINAQRVLDELNAQ